MPDYYRAAQELEGFSLNKRSLDMLLGRRDIQRNTSFE